MTAGPPTLGRAVVRRIACALVRAEATRLRGVDGLPLPTGDWSDEIRLDERGLDLDSLERLGALGTLAESFRLAENRLPATPPACVGDWLDWIADGFHPETGLIAVRTSGSTGVPKLCLHDVSELLAEAQHLATRVPGRGRVVALVPAHHLYGIVWTVLLPAALGVDAVDRTLGSPLGLEPGDLVVAVPDQWRAIVRLGLAVPDDCIAVSSAGTMDADLASDLLRVGFRRVVDVYGSSETGAIAIREAPDPSYELLPRWDLVVRGDDWFLQDRKGCLLPLPDHIEHLGERRLRPTARRDGAVKIGGRNVWPERVAGVLRETVGVAEVAVRLGAQGRLKAFVVPLHDVDVALLLLALETAAFEGLEPAERPRSYRFGSSLPRNMMGKLADWNEIIC